MALPKLVEVPVINQTFVLLVSMMILLDFPNYEFSYNSPDFFDYWNDITWFFS